MEKEWACTMKVLNLQCGQSHVFEGWFGSEEDYQSQRARGLVACPLCGDDQVNKLPSAPRLNLGATEPVKPANSPAASIEEPLMVANAVSPDTAAPMVTQQMQAAILNAMKHVLANTEDVGAQFAEEARKMHYGETQDRSIRGQATREEAESLREEGIEIMSLPIPDILKGSLQ
jgi:hypothetical protein